MHGAKCVSLQSSTASEIVPPVTYRATPPSRTSPESSTSFPPMVLPWMLTSGICELGFIDTMNDSSRVARVPSSNITVSSYSPGMASIRWNVPDLTMGPLNDPSPEKVPVPFIVP